MPDASGSADGEGKKRLTASLATAALRFPIPIVVRRCPLLARSSKTRSTLAQKRARVGPSGTAPRSTVRLVAERRASVPDVSSTSSLAGPGSQFALNMSALTIQLPSACFFQTVRYLPSIWVGAPSGAMVIW